MRKECVLPACIITLATRVILFAGSVQAPLPVVIGSVRVKAGDVVKEGRVIGLVGNSRNSDLPHHHFQVVTDTPSFLGAEGFSHAYRSFDSLGRINQTHAGERQVDPGYTMDRLWPETG